MIFEVNFERMTLDDLDGVMAVEHTAFVTPWSRRAFVTELTENAYAYYIVAKMGQEVIGYGGMWLIIDEAHVTNIAVHGRYRGQGIGERLMLELIQAAKDRGCLRMTLEVRRSNLPAQSLYTKLGFEARGVRRGYYTDTREDAIVMWKDHL